MSSAIKTTYMEGDVSVGRHVSMGGRASVAGSVLVGHNLKVEGWLDAPNIKGVNKGVYLSAEALRNAYPNPKEGWFAGVGRSTPFSTYVVIDGEWVDSGGKMEINVDMARYTEEVEHLHSDVDELRVDLHSDIDELRGDLDEVRGDLHSNVVRSRELDEYGEELSVLGFSIMTLTESQFDEMSGALNPSTLYVVVDDVDEQDEE